MTDLDWSSHNDYLVSCSLDQTTRVFIENSSNSSWFEVSRAQIHGYDLNAVKNLKVKGTERVVDVLVSAADEKIIRLFEPSSLFPNMVNSLSPNHDLRLYFPSSEEEEKFLVKNEKGTVEYKI